MTRQAQVTIPIAVRSRLGVGTPDNVAFVLDDEAMRLKPASASLARLFGSVSALANALADGERKIDDAMTTEINPRFRH